MAEMSEFKSNDAETAAETAPPSGDAAERYLVLINQHERSIAAYVHTLVNQPADAEDILQACRLTMWKKFDQFEEGTHFVAWARKIALHQVLNHRRSAKRKPVHTTDPALIEAIAAEIDRQSESLSARSEALHECLQRLPEGQRQTILLRYFEDCDIPEIAHRTSRTEGAVYRLLSRIRAALNDCVTEKLSPSNS
jgi:RNA polymerase sigma-70 factor (ECF subfamily)